MATAPQDDRQAKIAAASGKHNSNLGKIIAAIVVASLVVFGIIFAVMRSGDSGPKDLNAAAGTGTTSGAATTATPKLPKSVTAANAPIIATNGGVMKEGVPTLAVFEDFQCPICHESEKGFGVRVRQLGEAGKINVKYYLRTFLDQNLNNDSSTRAANAAGCAADAGKFFDFHEKLFAKQPEKEGVGYPDDVIKATATESGITGAAADTWAKCAADKTYVPYLQGLEKWSSDNGLNSTPKFFVNDKLFNIDPKSSADDFEKKLFEAAKS